MLTLIPALKKLSTPQEVADTIFRYGGIIGLVSSQDAKWLRSMLDQTDHAFKFTFNKKDHSRAVSQLRVLGDDKPTRLAFKLVQVENFATQHNIPNDLAGYLLSTARQVDGSNLKSLIDTAMTCCENRSVSEILNKDITFNELNLWLSFNGYDNVAARGVKPFLLLVDKFHYIMKVNRRKVQAHRNGVEYVSKKQTNTPDDSKNDDSAEL